MIQVTHVTLEKFHLLIFVIVYDAYVGTGIKYVAVSRRREIQKWDRFVVTERPSRILKHLCKAVDVGK